MDLSYKKVIKLLNVFSTDIPYEIKIEQSIKLLDIEVDNEDKEFVLNEITNYLFNTKQKNSGKKVFDLELDFKYYWADFKAMGVDLNKDNVGWWEFDTMLECILINDKSTISKIIGFRTYEKPPKKYDENKEHRYYLEKQRQYALPNPKSVESGFEKLWKFTEGKVKKNE